MTPKTMKSSVSQTNRAQIERKDAARAELWQSFAILRRAEEALATAFATEKRA